MSYQYNFPFDTLGFWWYEELVEAVEPGEGHLDVQHQDLQRQRDAIVHLHCNTLLVSPGKKTKNFLKMEYKHQVAFLHLNNHNLKSYIALYTF